MTQAAAGWYPDSTEASMERYWDGAVWTDQRRPAQQEVSGREARRAAKDASKAAQAAQDAEAAFWQSLQGQARLAYNRGDLLFQTSMQLHAQRGVISWLQAKAKGQAQDWSAELNSMVREGWDLVNASVVFRTTGQETRDKIAGQAVAVSGEVVGYYIFRRDDSKRVAIK
jgi:hypothetical protein